jgi:two-component system nitrate/nitrite sensor histidine kinase NarX
MADNIDHSLFPCAGALPSMLKRLFTPLSLVNQVALTMLLSTVIGVAGMAVSGWLVLGVQGSAHAINKAGSLRMQSYRLLASVPLRPADDVLLKEMEQTAFSSELADVAERDGQQEQLEALQHFWRNEVAPALKQAQEPQAVTDKIATYVNRIDTLVTAFDHSTEQRMARVVILHRVMAILLGLLLLFTVVWLRARLLQPWEQLLKMAQAVSQRNFTRRAQISGRNEMATLGTALNNMSEELAESYAVLEQRVQEKPPDLNKKTRFSLSCGRPTIVCIRVFRCANVCHRCFTGCKT